MYGQEEDEEKKRLGCSYKVSHFLPGQFSICTLRKSFRADAVGRRQRKVAISTVCVDVNNCKQGYLK